MAAGLVLALLAQPAAAQNRTYALYVSAVDSSAAPITGLSASDFVVRRNGASVPVLSAGRAEEPLDVVLLVDNSQALGGALETVRQGLVDFVNALRPETRVALLTFGERPLLVENLTDDPSLIRQAIDRLVVRTGSGAHLIDAVAQVARSAARNEAARVAFVVVACDSAEFSRVSPKEAIRIVGASGAVLHALVLASQTQPMTTPTTGGRAGGEAGLAQRHGQLMRMTTLSDAQRDREMLLTRATAETGGVFERLAAPQSLETALRRLARELSQQYLVTYEDSRSLRSSDRIEIEVKRPSVTARVTRVKGSPD